MIAKATIGIIPDYKFPDWLGLPWTSEVCYSLVCDLLRIIGIFQSFSHIMNLNNGRNTFYGCSRKSTVWKLFCLTFKNGFLSINLFRSWSTLVTDIAKMGSDAILLNFLESSNENIHAQCNSAWLKYLKVCKFRGSDI